MPPWTKRDIPDLTGKRAIVTGASSGIGAVAAEALAAKGADVVLAVRDGAKGDAVARTIRRLHPGAKVRVMDLDLADLEKVRSFAAAVVAEAQPLDILLNNAGLGMQRQRALTHDGFERQFGTNHLGHFALTALLFPALLRAPAPRVVTIASLVHWRGRIDFDDPQGERHYDGGKAYNQSKLANIMFALELDRRARGAGLNLKSLAAHPGIASTGFISATLFPSYQQVIANAVVRLIGQDAEAGALPGLYAATMPQVEGAQYWGPDGRFELRGAPAPARLAPRAKDRGAWARLWALSEALTQVSFPELPRVSASS